MVIMFENKDYVKWLRAGELLQPTTLRPECRPKPYQIYCANTQSAGLPNLHHSFLRKSCWKYLRFNELADLLHAAPLFQRRGFGGQKGKTNPTTRRAPAPCLCSGIKGPGRSSQLELDNSDQPYLMSRLSGMSIFRANRTLTVSELFPSPRCLVSHSLKSFVQGAFLLSQCSATLPVRLLALTY